MPRLPGHQKALSRRLVTIMLSLTIAIIFWIALPMFAASPSKQTLTFEPLSTGTTTQWRPTGLAGSEVHSIAISPTFASDLTLYAGGDSGLFRSDDAGASWAKQMDADDTMFIDIAISPAYASDKTLFAVEKVANGPYVAYKSSDGGEVWSVLTDDVRNIEVSPSFEYDSTLFAVFGDGLYESEYGGENWSKLDTPYSDLEYYEIFSVVFSPDYNEDQIIFLATSVGAFKSENGGTTWSGISPGLTDDDAPVVNALAVSPAFGSDKTLFAGVSHGETVGALYKSVDAGQTWTESTPGPDEDLYPLIAPSSNYFLDGRIFVGSYYDNIYESVDRGVNWSPLVGGLPDTTSINALAVSPNYGEDNILFTGTSDGIFVNGVGADRYWNFGSVSVDSTVSKSFAIQNWGLDALQIGNISISGDSVFGISNDYASDTTLDVSDTASLTANFSPTHKGQYSATISIPTNDLDDPIREIHLTGSSKGAARLVLSAGSLDFGVIPFGSEKHKAFSLTNAGDLSADVAFGPIGGWKAEDYSMSSGGGNSLVLAPGDAVSIDVTFEPTTLRTGYRNLVATRPPDIGWPASYFYLENSGGSGNASSWASAESPYFGSNLQHTYAYAGDRYRLYVAVPVLPGLSGFPRITVHAGNYETAFNNIFAGSVSGSPVVNLTRLADAGMGITTNALSCTPACYLSFFGSEADLTAPATTPSLEPVSPNGSAGWYTAAPSVTLSRNEAGSTYFQWDGTDGSGWTLYSSPTVAPVGAHSLNYFSVDAHGNTADVDTLAVNVDGAAPTNPSLSSASHSAGDASSDDTISLDLSGATDGAEGTGSGVGGYSIEWTKNAGTVPDATVDLAADVTGTTTNELPEGSWWAHLRTVDIAGNWSEATHAGPFMIDTTAPQSSVTLYPLTPTSGWYKSIPSISLTRNEVGTSKYQWDSTSSAGWKSYSGAAVYAPRGTHVLYYRSFDLALNAETVKSRTIRVDDYRPRTYAPYSATVKKYKYAKLYYKAKDPYCSLANIKIVIKNASGTTVKTLYPGWKGANSLRYVSYKASLPRGTYYFYVYASDKAGNKQYNIAKNKLVIK